MMPPEPIVIGVTAVEVSSAQKLALLSAVLPVVHVTLAVAPTVVSAAIAVELPYVPEVPVEE